ncbi:lamin tail domain-containing protein [Candidatus Gracilibacteria bacterium]|nr:lamin tail domain-containing protein [Candidatus Gracilibacteria bacterium]
MTKKYLALLSLLLLLEPFVSYADEPLSPLLFSEVAAYETSDHEWVELYNTSDTVIDLTTWKFFEDNTNHGIKAFEGSASTVEPHGLAVIANNADVFKQGHPQYMGTLVDSTWSSLKVEGELLGLKNAEGILFDSTIYSAGETASVERVIESGEWKARSEGNTLGMLYTTVEVTEKSAVVPEVTIAVVEEEPQVARNPIAPHAEIQVQSGELEATEKTSVNFDGRNSYDIEGGPVSFLWNFGDGVTSTSANPGIHTFSTPGSYDVRLTVTNTNGLASVAVQKVVVHPKSIVPSPAVAAPVVTTTTSKQEIKTAAPLYIVAYLSLDQLPPQLTNNILAVNNDMRPTSGEKNSVVISELYPAPATGSDEWIELHNISNSTVDISGWMLGDEAKAKKPYRIKEGTVISKNGYITFEKKTTKINLNNDQDHVYLATPDGALIDSASYRDAQKEKSYVYVDNGTWQWTAHVTKGKKNPLMRDIEATVTKKISAQAREIQIPNEDESTNEAAQLTIPESVMDTSLTEVLLDEGTMVAATVEPTGDNHYEAVRVNDVQLPQPPQKAEISWLLVIAMGGSALLIGWKLPRIVSYVRDWAEAEKLRKMV